MIPNDILRNFNNELKNLQHGKVSLTVIRRESHTHYEISKVFTLLDEEDEKSNKNNKEGKYEK